MSFLTVELTAGHAALWVIIIFCMGFMAYALLTRANEQREQRRRQGYYEDLNYQKYLKNEKDRYHPEETPC